MRRRYAALLLRSKVCLLGKLSLLIFDILLIVSSQVEFSLSFEIQTLLAGANHHAVGCRNAVGMWSRHHASRDARAHTLTHRVWSTVIKATLVGFALAKISPETFALIKCHVKRQIWSVSTHHLGSMFSFVNVLSYCNENTARHGILQRLNRDVQ